MLRSSLVFLFGILTITSATYIVTCHNDNECGTVCGSSGADTASPSEGLFGTTCTCQPGAQPTTKKCNRNGQDILVCSDNRPPRCNVPCNQKICIKKDGRQATATIRSACPRHHPVNTQQCCDYGGEYCTCITQDTLDLNWKPYQELGNNNGYSSSAYVGSCNQNTGIEHRSLEAKLYFALNPQLMCSAREINYEGRDIARKNRTQALLGSIEDVVQNSHESVVVRTGTVQQMD